MESITEPVNDGKAEPKNKAPKPPKRPTKTESKPDKEGVKIIDIPEKRAKRIQEINEEFARQRVSYDTRMHEILVTICDDLDIPQDMRAQYTPDFKSIIVQKERKAPPPPLEPK